MGALLASAQETEECFNKHGLGVANVSVSLDASGDSPLRVVHAGTQVNDEAGQYIHDTGAESEPIVPRMDTSQSGLGDSGVDASKRSMLELADAMSDVHAKILAFRTKVSSISVN